MNGESMLKLEHGILEDKKKDLRRRCYELSLNGLSNRKETDRFKSFSRKQIEDRNQESILAKHKQSLENIKKDFPVGFYIPELRASVTEIKDGCGTKEGWVDIYLSNKERPIKYWELRKKIREAKEQSEANEYFNKLKFSDTRQSLYIGPKDYETLERLIKVMELDLPTVEGIDDGNIDWLGEIMTSARKQAIEDGYTDDESEEKAAEAESEEMSLIYENHLSNILRTLNYLLNFHDIELEALKKGYYLTSKSWKEAAGKVANTITGYGTFEFNSAQELRDGLPCRTYCEAAIQHLHWLRHYPEVYGVSSYRRIYEK